jgi:tight adherence protein B
MMLLSAVLAAAVLALAGPARDGRALLRLRSDLSTGATVPTGRTRLLVSGAVPVAAGLLGVAAAGSLAGVAGTVVAASGLIAAGTTFRLIRVRQRSRQAAAARADVAHACRVLAGRLRAGRIPAEALHAAAVDCPVLAPGAALLDLGSDPGSQWREDSRRPGYQGLLVLARAWQTSARTGSPLAPALEQVSETLGEEVAVEQLVSTEVAAARATARIMAALPLCGVGIGYLIGGHPLQFLVSGPVGWSCLLGGVLLAAAGVLWIDWLARSVAEQGLGR